MEGMNRPPPPPTNIFARYPRGAAGAGKKLQLVRKYEIYQASYIEIWVNSRARYRWWYTARTTLIQRVICFVWGKSLKYNRHTHTHTPRCGNCAIAEKLKTRGISCCMVPPVSISSRQLPTPIVFNYTWTLLRDQGSMPRAKAEQG